MKTLIRYPLFILLLTAAALVSAEPEGSIKVAKKTPRWEQVAMAKITAADAMDIALTAVPGAVVELELEVDDGVLIYEVSVIGKSHETVVLEIDAGTGEILEREDDD